MSFADYIRELRETATKLEQPVMERMRRDISWAYSAGIDAEATTPYYALYHNLGSDPRYETTPQTKFREAFGGTVPKTWGEATDLLTRSMYPGWMSYAHGRASGRQNYAESFQETFQTTVTNFLTSLSQSTGTGKAAMPQFAFHAPHYMEADKPDIGPPLTTRYYSEKGGLEAQMIGAGIFDDVIDPDIEDFQTRLTRGIPEFRRITKKPWGVSGERYSTFYDYETYQEMAGMQGQPAATFYALRNLHGQVTTESAYPFSQFYKDLVSRASELTKRYGMKSSGVIMTPMDAFHYVYGRELPSNMKLPYIGGSDMQLVGYNMMKLQASRFGRHDYAQALVPFSAPPGRSRTGPYRPTSVPTGDFEFQYPMHPSQRTYAGPQSEWDQVEGEWHYTGAEDYVYFPDQGGTLTTPQQRVQATLADFTATDPQWAYQVMMGTEFQYGGRVPRSGAKWFMNKIARYQMGYSEVTGEWGPQLVGGLKYKTLMELEGMTRGKAYLEMAQNSLFPQLFASDPREFTTMYGNFMRNPTYQMSLSQIERRQRTLSRQWQLYSGIEETFKSGYSAAMYAVESVEKSNPFARFYGEVGKVVAAIGGEGTRPFPYFLKETVQGLIAKTKLGYREPLPSGVQRGTLDEITEFFGGMIDEGERLTEHYGMREYGVSMSGEEALSYLHGREIPEDLYGTYMNVQRGRLYERGPRMSGPFNVPYSGITPEGKITPMMTAEEYRRRIAAGEEVPPSYRPVQAGVGSDEPPPTPYQPAGYRSQYYGPAVDPITGAPMTDQLGRTGMWGTYAPRQRGGGSSALPTSVEPHETDPAWQSIMASAPPDITDVDPTSGYTYGDLYYHTQHRPRPQIMPILASRENFILRARTGWGKTEAMVAAAGSANARMSIIASPSTSLNMQLATEFGEAGVSAHFLPGYPGKGADPEALEAWETAQNDFLAELGVQFSRGGDPIITNRGRLRQSDTGEITWQGAPMSAHMSFEKLAISPESRLGRVWSLLNREGFLSFIGIDEADQLTQSSRHLGRYLADALSQVASGAKRMFVSGTLSPAQMRSIAEQHDIPEGNIVDVPYETDPRVTWRAFDAPSQKEAISTATRLATESQQPGILFTRIGQMEELKKRIEGVPGKIAQLFHKDQGQPLPKEHMERMEQKLTAPGSPGIDPNEVIISSTALAAGMNRRELGVATVMNPATAQLLGQAAGRVRGSDDEERFVNIVASESTFANRASRMRETVDWLADPTNLAKVYTDLRGMSRRGELSENWQAASRQMQAHIGEVLGQQGMYEHAKSIVPSVLNEADFIRLTQLKDASGESYFGYEFRDQGTTAEVAQRILQAKVRPTGRTGQSMSSEMAVTERMREDLGTDIREQVALGKIWRQSVGSGAFSDKQAGALIERASASFSTGGIEGLEEYADVLLPKELSDRYVKAVTAAAEAYEEAAATGANMNEATKRTTAAYNEAAQIVSTSPAAAQFAREQVGAMMESGSAAQQAAATTIYNQTGGLPVARAGYTGDIPVGAAPSGEGPPPRGRGRMTPGAAGLYGLYMARRMWQYTTAPMIQGAATAASIDWLRPSLVGTDITGAYGVSPAGYEIRQAIGAEARGAAAYDQFGFFMDAGYAASGLSGGGIGRMGATASMAGGLAAGGVEAGMGISMAGMAMPNDFGRQLQRFGTGIAVAGGLAGAGMLAIGGISELANIRDQTNYSLSDRFRMGVAKTAGYTHQYGLGQLIWNTAIFPQGTPDWIADAASVFGIDLRKGGGQEGYWNVSERVVRDAQRGWSPEVRNWIGYQGTSPQEQEVRGFASRVAMSVGATPEQLVGAATLGATWTGGFEEQLSQQFFERAPGLGMGVTDLVQSYAAIAGQMGYLPGSTQARQLMENFPTTPAALAQMQASAQRTAGYIAQISPYVGQQAAAGMITPSTTPTAVSALQQIFQDYTYRGGNLQGIARVLGGGTPESGMLVQTYGQLFNNLIAPTSEGGLGYGEQRISNLWGIFGPDLMDAGLSPEMMPDVMQGLAEQFRNVPASQMGIVAGIAGGDLRTMSYAANYRPELMRTMGMNPADWRFYGPAGRPIYQTSGRDFFRTMLGQWQMGNAGAAPFGQLATAIAQTPIETPLTGVQQVQTMLPNVSEGMAGAFWEGGTIGAQQWASDRMYQLQSAALGTQAAAIRETQGFLWGGGQYSGKPAPGSYWDLEDQLRKSQHRAQLRSFEFQKDRMDILNQYAVQREDIQLRRMEAGQEYQTYQMDYQGTRLGLQRQWMKEDWAYQDQMRGLQQGWAMEDIDEAIRFSTGRQRRQLERKRERMGITYGIEGERIETQRERQETLQKLEEERFEKQKEYTEEIMDTDKEAFELAVDQRETLYAMDREELQNRKEDYEEQYEIQEEMIEKSRAHQAAQMEYQLALLGIAQEQAKVQKDLEDTNRLNSMWWEDTEGSLRQINTYEQAQATIKALHSMVAVMDDETATAANALAKAARMLNNLDISDLISDLQWYVP